jgi:hypothetical protein
MCRGIAREGNSSSTDREEVGRVGRGVCVESGPHKALKSGLCMY